MFKLREIILNKKNNFIKKYTFFHFCFQNFSTNLYISGDVRDLLMIYTGRVNSAAYIEIIKDALPMFIKNAFDAKNHNCVYMHYNAPAHTSKYAIKWFNDKKY